MDTFLFVIQARYIAAWDKENYPAILLSSNQAFEFHGMGPSYKDNIGKVAIYINTVKGVGEHGRGGGQVTSAKQLAVGRWYTLTVEKTADQLCIQVDAEAPTCATRTVPVEDFRMKTPGSIRYPVGVNMESRNFFQISDGAGGDGAGGDGASGERRRRRRRRRRPAAGGDGAGGDGAGDGASGNGAGGDGGATSGTCSVDVGGMCGGLLGFNLVNTCDKKFGPTDC